MANPASDRFAMTVVRQAETLIRGPRACYHLFRARLFRAQPKGTGMDFVLALRYSPLTETRLYRALVPRAEQNPIAVAGAK